MIFNLEKMYVVKREDHYVVKGEDHEVKVLASTPDRMGVVPVVFIGGRHDGLYGSFHHSVLEEKFSQYLVEYRAPRKGDAFLHNGIKLFASYDYGAKYYVIVGGK